MGNIRNNLINLQKKRFIFVGEKYVFEKIFKENPEQIIILIFQRLKIQNLGLTFI